MSTGYSSFAIVMWMPWTVSLHPQAEAELRRIPVAERAAVLNAAQNWRRSALISGIRIRVLCVMPTGSGSCAPERVGARGGGSTAG